jgi:hypothetical protein
LVLRANSGRIRLTEALLELQGGLRDVVLGRARELEEAHRRIRRTIGTTVRGLKVEPYWPPDVLGLLVLQPVVGR